MKSNQKGFSVVELLIVIVIIGLVGTVGWLVYDRQKSKSDDKVTTTQASQQDQKEETPKKEEVKQPTYFEIKELGVKFELTDNLTGLYYSIGNNGKTAYFSLNDLKGTYCAADKTAQVALTRYTDADFDVDFTASKEGARKIGSYYFMSVGGQAGCSEDNAIQEKASQLRSDITKLLPAALVTL